MIRKCLCDGNDKCNVNCDDEDVKICFYNFLKKMNEVTRGHEGSGLF